MADLGFWNFAQREPDALALVAPFETELTRGELLAACNRMVHGLRELGLERGDVLAIDSVTCAEYFVTSLACSQTGLYLTPINWHLAPAEVAYILADCGAKVLIAHENVGEVCVKAAKEAGFPVDRSFAIGEIAGFGPKLRGGLALRSRPMKRTWIVVSFGIRLRVRVFDKTSAA